MIRILHIVSNISIRSGVMSFIMNYYRHIDRREFQFDFIYYDQRKEDYTNEIKSLGGNAFVTPNPVNLNAFKKYKAHFMSSYKNKYDIIHLHDPFLIPFYRDFKKKLGAKVFISHSHSTRMSDKRLLEIRNRFFYLPFSHFPDYYWSCSSIAGIKTFGKNMAKELRVINNAIDLDKFNNSPEKRKKMRHALNIDDCFVIGHVGNFTEPKNHEFIVKVFAQIKKIQTNAVLVLVGQGEKKEHILEMFRKQEIIDSVLFLGVRDDVFDIYCSFDRFLFPSIFEGFGIALIEAQACGIPCIYSSAIPKETNIFPTNNEILSLSDNISNWVKAIIDPNKNVLYNTKEEIKKAGYDIYTEAKRLEESYRSTLYEKE